VNHYCTYFDRNFLAQGLAMVSSIRQHDAHGVIWVLCLDDFTAQLLGDMSAPYLRPIRLTTLEAADDALHAIKVTRTLVEYYFTLSPCWPRYLLRSQPAIERITYVDADMYFFNRPIPIIDEMGSASVLVTEHRYPHHLRHHLRCGRFNVGLLSFRNDDAGRSCLDDWRERCLEWCHDRAEDGKYADQKYLDRWPAQLGERLHVVNRPGVNLAPWNWSRYHYTFQGEQVYVDGAPLELFHFARFRPSVGTFWFQSGQLEYGVMPWQLRQRIYGPYWQAMQQALREIHRLRPTYGFIRHKNRGWHGFWKAFLPRLLFGSDWLRVGPVFLSGRFSLGRYSGHILSRLRHLAANHSPSSAVPEMPDPPALAAPAERE
jgi:hypothetical protein